MICGLTLESSIEDLAIKFLAVVQSLAYGTKHIVQELQRYVKVSFFHPFDRGIPLKMVEQNTNKYLMSLFLHYLKKWI